MNTNKIAAAKRLAASLESDGDFLMFLYDHPNERRAMKRLSVDVATSAPVERRKMRPIERSIATRKAA